MSWDSDFFEEQWIDNDTSNAPLCPGRGFFVAIGIIIAILWIISKFYD